MRGADYIRETTTSIAGSSGDGAVTLTQATGYPRVSTAFGTNAKVVRYVIEDTVNHYFESGIGSCASNVLTRTRPQITWNGTTWDDSTPSPLAFGSTPTSGNIVIRLAPTAEAQAPNIVVRQATVAGDTNWRDYDISAVVTFGNNGTGYTATADREQYVYHKTEIAGLLTGIQYEVTANVALSNIKVALYEIGTDGLPGTKIVDFVTTATTTTGIKTDTATGSWNPAVPVWLTPGWYVVGFICSHAIGLRGLSGSNIQNNLGTPLGRKDAYGRAMTIFVAGSYSTGLPATASLSGGTIVGNGNTNAYTWFGLKIVA